MMDENVNLLEISPDVIDHIRSAVAEAYDKPEFQIRFNPQNKFYYLFVDDRVEPIPINILTGAPLEERIAELGATTPDTLFDADHIKRSNDFNEDYIVYTEFIPDTLFDTDYLLRSTEDNSTKVLTRYGTHGQKWGHRYHQSYRVKPRRSGKFGEEHGDAAKQTSRLNQHKNNKNNYNININKKGNKASVRVKGQYKGTKYDIETNNVNVQFQNGQNNSNKKKTTFDKLLYSGKNLINKQKRKAEQKEYNKLKKLQEKNRKLQMKNQQIEYKNRIKAQKEYNKMLKQAGQTAKSNKIDSANMMSQKEYNDKARSLMEDSPKVIMKKWKGKLDNNDLKYLKQRMGLETHINKQINPPFDFGKAWRNVSMVGKGLVTANNVFSDFYNTMNANEIEKGTTRPWPRAQINNYNKNQNNKRNNRNNRNKRS